MSSTRLGLGRSAAVVDIGAVEDVGYVSREARVRDLFHQTSTYTLSEQAVLDSLQLMLRRGTNPSQASVAQTQAGGYVCKAQIAIGIRSTQPLAAASNRVLFKTDPRAAGYRNIEEQDPANGSNTADGMGNSNAELKRLLQDMASDPTRLDTEEIVQQLAHHIGAALFGFLTRDVAELDLHTSFNSMGMDSFVSIELRNWIKVRMGVDIPMLGIIDSSSFLALGKSVAGKLKAKLSAKE